MALTTRPSQPSDGRTAAGATETIARQPRRTPSSAPKGISSALLPMRVLLIEDDSATAQSDRADAQIREASTSIRPTSAKKASISASCTITTSSCST
jgi:hypothetical protein